MNNKVYKNFIGEEIKTGDTVVYLQNYRTGGSTVRKCKFIGTITDFKGDRAIIEPHGSYDTFVTPNDYQHFPEVKIYINDIICIINM